MSNSLKNEVSPYLLSHSEDPVDWLPWGQEAFDKARREDKPIFLSIGYSTCHWCHVMQQLCFKDREVAEVLNRAFVSVKVDREERPEVDSIYLSACQALTGSAGWPLTIIMTADQKPFFAATYMPRDSQAGQAGLLPLLLAIEQKWQRQRRELIDTAGQISAFLRQPQCGSPQDPSKDWLESAAQQLRSAYDEEYGGFGRGAKFPCPAQLIFLLRLAHFTKDKSLRSMADNTLRQMYRGGIWDHFGGGFCRYSTDREWLLPHFEKTLYDNALLSFCYTEAWQDGHMALYRNVAEDCLDYCLRELMGPEGGFYCAQDADSRGKEGAYYLFTPSEVAQVLGAEAGKHFCNCYDITDEGNHKGKSIPNLLLNNRWNFLPEGYDEYREELRLYREQRFPLAVDDKQLCAWNGMMLMALSRAAWAFKDKRYLMQAEELAAYMAKSFYKNGELIACLCKGKADMAAHLDDYVWYALGLLELYRAEFRPEHLLKAIELAKELCRRFAGEKGGLYLCGEDQSLLYRPMEILDGAIPSGNSAAAVLFQSLFSHTADPRWQKAAQDQLAVIYGSCKDGRELGCCYAALALMGRVYGEKQLVCVCPDESIPQSLEAVLGRWAPELTALLKSPARAEALAKAAPFTRDMLPAQGKASYHLCENGACSLPVTDIL